MLLVAVGGAEGILHVGEGGGMLLASGGGVEGVVGGSGDVLLVIDGAIGTRGALELDVEL